MKTIKIIFLLLFICVEVCAQRPGEHENGNFVYENEGDTVLVRLSTTGISNIITNKSISIPSNVKRVVQGAFSLLQANGQHLLTLVIEGNPKFEKADNEGGESSLDDNTSEAGVQSHLTTIEMGSNMSQENMQALLLCLESRHSLSTVEITGNVGSISWTSEPIKAVLTSDVAVNLPATMVTNQVFGDAKVYGVFPINYDYATTCVGATFVDKDDGSNYLFYIPTETIPGKKTVRFHRVHYVNANAGILLHRVMSTADRARLLRIDNVNSYVDALEGNAKTIYNGDQAIYQNNMLVGSVNPQTIEAKVGGYTNMILYNGSFIPTSGGTLGANKAYLRIPTSYLGGGASGAKVFMAFDSGVTGIVSAQPTDERNGDAVYDLQGRKVAEDSPSLATSKTLPRGIYIRNGKKIARK